MFATSVVALRRTALFASSAVIVTVLALFVAGSWQSPPPANAQEPVRPAKPANGGHTTPVAEQPAAKIVADPPKPEPLARGVAIVQFRTENVQIVPVFGPTAASVSPRIGHLHVTVDDTPWHWAHTSNDPV